MNPTVGLCMFLLAASTPTMDLVPPERPIVATTEIADVALETGHLLISVHATLTTNEVSAAVWVLKIPGGAKVLTLEPAEIPPMCKLLEEAGIAVSTRKAFSGAAGHLSIKASGAAESSWAALEFRTDGSGPERCLLNPQGATQLARALAQGKAAADWLLAKLKTIQPQPLPR